jgi:hypothetical protein
MDMGLFTGSTKQTTASAGSSETKKLHTEYSLLLVDGEIIEIGFTVTRDVFLFTNKRLILVTVQGISGKQIDYFSVPYRNITKFSIETGDKFDLDAELKIWIGGDTIPLEKKFNKDVSIYELHKVLARHVLNVAP